jgi:hypothetical protein
MYSVPIFYLQRLISFLLFLPYILLAAFSILFSGAMGGLWRPKLYALHGVEWRLSEFFYSLN